MMNKYMDNIGTALVGGGASSIIGVLAYMVYKCCKHRKSKCVGHSCCCDLKMNTSDDIQSSTSSDSLEKSLIEKIEF